MACPQLICSSIRRVVPTAAAVKYDAPFVRSSRAVMPMFLYSAIPMSPMRPPELPEQSRHRRIIPVRIHDTRPVLLLPGRPNFAHVRFGVAVVEDDAVLSHVDEFAVGAFFLPEPDTVLSHADEFFVGAFFLPDTAVARGAGPAGVRLFSMRGFAYTLPLCGGWRTIRILPLLLLGPPSRVSVGAVPLLFVATKRSKNTSTSIRGARAGSDDGLPSEGMRVQPERV